MLSAGFSSKLRLSSSLLRSFSTFTTTIQPAPRAADAVTTHPRPLGLGMKYVKKSDIVHDFGNMKLIRARPDHICFLKNSMYDFLASEATMQGMNIEPEYDFAWTFVYNMTRYPLSHFVISDKNEVIGMALQHVVYKNPANDPIPSIDFNMPDEKSNNLHVLTKLLDWSEQRHLEVLGVDKFVHHEISYTPSVLRRQRLASTWYPVVMKLVCEEAWTKMGIKWSAGMTTGESNRRNIAKLHYKFTERIPEEIYKDAEGKICKPNGEETAYLCYLNMEEAVKKNYFGQ